MRTLKFTAALLAVGMLSIASLAYASAQFTQTANVALTAVKAGKPTGLKAALLSTDPGAMQPQGLKTLTITLPTATKFNFKSSAIKQCKASEEELKALGSSACPAKSKIGSGSGVANGAPVLPIIPESVTAFAGKNQIIFLLDKTGPTGQRIILYGKVSANKVKTEVPVINAGGLNVVITSLTLNVKTIGHGKKAFITAGKCKAGKFTVKSSFVYQTGATLTVPSSSKCSK